MGINSFHPETVLFALAVSICGISYRHPGQYNDHYCQVYFYTNRVIREAFGEAGFPVPEQHW
jgi:small conductance mechanosensitive channel